MSYFGDPMGDYIGDPTREDSADSVAGVGRSSVGSAPGPVLPKRIRVRAHWMLSLTFGVVKPRHQRSLMLFFGPLIIEITDAPTW